jgi:kynureninase
LITALGRGHVLKTVAPESIEAELNKNIAVLMLTEVDYRTGRKHNMAALTAKARALGIITIWDLAHSAGALPVDVAGVGADFAAGCTYKFINGGPGAPAFLYVAPRHANHISPILPGWMGHHNPFAFTPDYAPAAGVERMRIGTPPVIAMAALEASLDIWDNVDMAIVRRQSILLGDLLISEVSRACPNLQLISPRDGVNRGSQVSFVFEQGYAAIQALVARGVVGDFRAPDIMRFGICPLYIDEQDICDAAGHIAAVINNRLWDVPEFLKRKTVT